MLIINASRSRGPAFGPMPILESVKRAGSGPEAELGPSTGSASSRALKKVKSDLCLHHRVERVGSMAQEEVLGSKGSDNSADPCTSRSDSPRQVYRPLTLALAEFSMQIAPFIAKMEAKATWEVATSVGLVAHKKDIDSFLELVSLQAQDV